MGQFAQGQSGNPVGRPKGARNKTTTEVKALCQRMLHDKAYRRKLQERMLRGKLPPAMEVLLWHYAFGKPKEP